MVVAKTEQRQLSHLFLQEYLPLALLVLRVFTNYGHATTPPNDFAMFADAFNRSPYFHNG